MTVRYLATATGLGFVWYAVLQLPSTTRSFMAGIGHVTAALLLCLVSIVVALALRRFIASSENDLRLMVVGPYSGAVVLPMGYVAQRAMRWASGEDHRPAD